MHDPHVKALHYRIIHDDTVDYEKAVPLDHETDVFSVHVEDGAAVFTFKEHYADVGSAIGAIQPFISTWEAHVYLNGGADEFQLEYKNAEIIDRDPQLEPPGRGALRATVGSVMTFGVAAKLHVGRGRYPEPPSAFVASPDVQVVLLRYKLYRKGHERISSMGYFVYSALTESAGGKKEAADMYGISQKVLHKLSELTTTKGGKEEGRKTPYGQPYTPRERTWIDAAVKALIRRAGEWAANADAARPQINMKDLPSLD